MQAHLGRVYYCDYCMQGYDSNVSHSCINLCKCCKSLQGLQSFVVPFENRNQAASCTLESQIKIVYIAWLDNLPISS